MNSISSISRSVILFFSETAFYDRLNSNPINKKTLLVAQEASPLEQQSSALNSERIEISTVDQNITRSTFKGVNQFLGLETDLVFFDTTKQFDVNAFTAICGTIVGGGELVVLLEERLRYAIKSRNLSNIDSGVSKTLLRFLRALLDQQNIEAKPLANDSIQFVFKDNNNACVENRQSKFEASQKLLVESIKRCATGHARRPLVVSANRGRGKSAALGIATAELLFKSNISVFVTAPRKQQLSVFYRHLSQRLNELTSSENALLLTEKRLTFLPPDEASAQPKISGLLIIEEAGAIPTQVLTRFLDNSNRTVFSTTVDGYEGNGQGFEIRFRKLLKDSFPQSKSLSVTLPARWPEQDLLENAINSAFILNQPKSKTSCPEGKCRLSVKPQFYLLSKQQLNSDEPLLKSVYQLLVNAHYQTRPSDLEKILSQDSLYVFVAKQGIQLLAAALVCREGNMTQAEVEEIQENNARIPGQLLPQSLIAHQGINEAANLAFLRVMRIAVNPDYRRQGIASRLLEYIENYAVENGINLLGTSFSLFTDVVRFWYTNGFAALRIGVRKDSSTGSHTGEFLKLLNYEDQDSKHMFDFTLRKFNGSFCYLVSSSLKVVSTEILLCIGLMQPKLSTINKETIEEVEHSKQEIEQYFAKKRSLEMVEWQLYLLAKGFLFGTFENQSINAQDAILLKDYALIYAKIIQRKNWQEITFQFQFTGIKQSREETRLALQRLCKLQ